MSVKKIAICFSGSGTNMEALIKKLHKRVFKGKNGKTKIEVALLITNNPNAGGIARAKKYGLDTLVIDHRHYLSRAEFDEALIKAIKAVNVDLVVLAGFMRILGAEFCQSVKAINLHPSILPLFKGAHAIAQSFESDMMVGGITIHWVSAELDGGKIIAQKTFARKNRSLEQWEAKTHELEHKLLPKVVVDILTSDCK